VAAGRESGPTKPCGAGPGLAQADRRSAITGGRRGPPEGLTVTLRERSLARDQLSWLNWACSSADPVPVSATFAPHGYAAPPLLVHGDCARMRRDRSRKPSSECGSARWSMTRIQAGVRHLAGRVAAARTITAANRLRRRCRARATGGTFRRAVGREGRPGWQRDRLSRPARTDRARDSRAGQSSLAPDRRGRAGLQRASATSRRRAEQGSTGFELLRHDLSREPWWVCETRVHLARCRTRRAHFPRPS